METNRPIRLWPTMPMLAESLAQAGWECRMHLSREEQSYRGIRLYHRQQVLHEDVLYLLRPGETHFPTDTHSYLSAVPLEGRANHLICPRKPDEEILDQLLEVFSQFQNWEDAMDLLLYRNESLQTLCDLGAQLLENPVCIHDDWFVMMAMTREFNQIMEPEYLMSSDRGFVPRAVVEDFQYDSDYLETYSAQEPRVWYSPEQEQYTLYVNLWDGAVYKGRLLVARKNRDFLKRDFLLAEALTQRAVMLLQRKQPGEETGQQNMDDIVFSLLQGKQPHTLDLALLLDMLHWQKTDRFLCLRIRPQQSGSPAMMKHLLHSDLFRSFPGSYILMDRREQCMILNMTREHTDLNRLRHTLAPLCRDYCLYAGIGSPVTGIRELSAGYYQAGAALEQAFQLRSEKWILSFSECALEHLARNLPAPLLPMHLVAPELIALMDYDREKGTQYFATFREYLLRERDIPATARALIIHRTTLLYRLEKIRSLMSLDPEDPWQRLYLVLSLWLLEREQSK